MNTLPLKTLTTLVAAGAVIGLAGTGTASAATQPTGQAQQQVTAPPRGKAAATANPLYKTGRLASSNCSPGSLPRGSTAAYKRFLTRVTNCLNRSWATQFRKAGLPFSKPRLRIITKKVRTPCGPWSAGADGVYCSADRTMYMLITKTQLRRPYALGITRLMAHEYGHHVQQVSGIWNYYWSARNSTGRSGQLQLSRRSELQAECFSAAFMSTIRNTLPVDPAEWDHTVEWFRQNGAKAWAQNDHGKGPTQAFWMNRGFNSGSPGSCNTWRVSARYVS
ncbi:neutral zinc metallopeptidase [Nonomuraea cavernae]|uniref:Peptidase n=1 Tax=Nonomuraea cavernae TaxID=2045107 RepID=A0A917Z1Z2_9ACTN|nr:neutral zinc metallopeptidase [Nonomuraea cavernae]MCA2187703.1 neutral zinc metallopeptidase [Nonomuraea cavernae]GGO70758.1 peptidase [Nonomuraea cavernae]